ncbi:MAG: hypothetical protein MJ051_07890 [Akkermansia sp.]|nr:hypothetical protein [Akkermansia sp.]
MSDERNETSVKPSIGQYIGLWTYKAFYGLLYLSDIRVVALIGRGIGYLVWICFPSRRRIVARNFRIVVDPMLRADKLRPLVRRNMVRTSMNLACSLKTGILSDREAARAISVEGREIFRDAGLGGHTAISCVPHAGNWEILARIRPYFPEIEHFGCMYRKLSNPLLEDLVLKSRTRYGSEMFSKEAGLRAVLKLARTGGLLGVLSDQFTQEGIFVPYFGKVTGTTPLPALLHKRCKGMGILFSVYTRNRGLGKWEAVVSQKIKLPEGCESLAAITLEVNKALEKCLKEDIIDGFWMHHRWKATDNFAPKQDDDVNAVAKANMRLPFRIIICVPERFEEAVLTLPALRVLKASRFDAQLTLICPKEQQAFWQRQDIISHTATTDGETSLLQQLDADEIYKDGPFDYLFMFSENKRVFRDLQHLMPMYVSGFAENPLAKQKRAFRKRISRLNCGHPRHAAEDYLHLLSQGHFLDTSAAYPQTEQAETTSTYIAPFSTLGSADAWQQEKWAELVSRLPIKPRLLALPADRERAEAMAAALGVEALILPAEEVADHLNASSRLYAVDGLLPQLAAIGGARCTVIMASRAADRYAPLGEGHRICTNHTPCHPCERCDCDMQTPCTAGISVEDMLAE